MVFFRLFAGEAPLDADAAPPGPPACFLHVRDAGVAARPPSAFMVGVVGLGYGARGVVRVRVAG